KENYSEQTFNVEKKKKKGIRKLVVFLNWNELDFKSESNRN
ncbi:hypothetical protein DORLON_02992, partial [Dorea longicatena DSM 13814]